MSVVIVGVRLGIEVIARSAEILFPWFVGLFGLLILSMIPQIKIEHIQPVFEIHPKAFIRAVLTFLSMSSLTYTILLMIFLPIHQTQKSTQSFLYREYSRWTSDGYVNLTRNFSAWSLLLPNHHVSKL